MQRTEEPAGYDSHLVAALGINWAHAVTTRLVLEAKSGRLWFFRSFRMYFCCGGNHS